MLFSFISDPMKCITLELSSLRIWIQLHHRPFSRCVSLACLASLYKGVIALYLFVLVCFYFFLMLAASHRFEYMLKAWLHGSLLAVISVLLIFVLFSS